MTRIKGQLTTSDYLPIDEFNRLCDCLRKDKQYTWAVSYTHLTLPTT